MMNIVICVVIAVAGFAILMGANSAVAKSLKKKEENANKNTGTIIFIIIAIVYLVVLASSCYFLL